MRGGGCHGSHIGTLAVGKAADLVLIDWDKPAYPYLDPEMPVLDAVLQRAKSEGVALVMVAARLLCQLEKFSLTCYVNIWMRTSWSCC